jgi:hypothetical protein
MPIISVINRFAADRQFILIARNGVSQRPINVTMIGIAYALNGRTNAEPILFWNKYKNDYRNMYNENSDEEYFNYKESHNNKEDDFENDNDIRPKKKSTLNDNNLRDDDDEEEEVYNEVQEEDKKSSVRNNTKNQNAGQQKQRVDN